MSNEINILFGCLKMVQIGESADFGRWDHDLPVFPHRVIHSFRGYSDPARPLAFGRRTVQREDSHIG